MSEKIWATSPEKKAALESIRLKFTGIDSKAQRRRATEALSQFRLTSFELMRHLDIYDPRPRIFELRHQFGYKIKTLWETVLTESGDRHRVACYVLESEGDHE